MSASMDSDPDIALFREDLVILKRDVASLIEHIKGGATNNVQNATNQIERHVRSLRQEAGAQGERSAQAVSVFTEKQSLVALVIAVGIGYVGARVLRRGDSMTDRQDCSCWAGPRVAGRDRLDISHVSLFAPRSTGTPHKSVPCRVEDERFGATSPGSLAAG